MPVLLTALEPAGRDAERILTLLLVAAGVGLVVWVAALGLGARSFGRTPRNPVRTERILIGVGGLVVPVALLLGLLAAGLPVLDRTLEPGPPGPVRLSVSGEQWWWRVTYVDDNGEFEAANELHLVVGRRVAVALDSPDVIHSLWIPALAGKVDLVPGRRTTLPLEPTRTGRFRGVCAEYCGLSHANMALEAVVLEAGEHAAWLGRERGPARVPVEPAFLSSGCGACHTVRGTPANGNVGPDLTHVASRRHLGAGVLPSSPAGFRAFLVDPEGHKPGVRMPSFAMLTPTELSRIADWLARLD